MGKVETKVIQNNQKEREFKSFITKNDLYSTATLFIPGDELLDVFTTSEIEQLVLGNTEPIIERIRRRIRLDKYEPVLDDKGLTMTWKVDDERMDLTPYLIKFPHPIPEVLKIPLTTLQKILRTSEYSVILEKHETNKFSAKKNKAGVYVGSLTLKEIESKVSSASARKAKFKRIEDRDFIFVLA